MAWNKYYILTSALILCSVIQIDGQGCTMVDKCTCSMDDGSGDVKLDSLSRSDGSAMFQDMQASDGYYYSYNPCSAFNEGDCNNAAACQQSADRQSYYLIGDADSAQFSYDGLNVHLSYTGSDNRQTDVVLVCDPNTDGTLVANGEISDLVYAFTLTTKCACAGGCTGGTPDPGPGPTKNPGKLSDGDISIGTILCVVILGILAVYLLSGVVFQKVAMQASGKEIIPNVTFWTALPGLIKDGFVFTFSKCSPSAYRSI